MPLLKVYVDAPLWEKKGEAVQAVLPNIRNYLCEAFNVEVSLCQILLIPSYGLSDQPPMAAEIQIMPKPERTPELILSACQKLRAMLGNASGEYVVIRATQLDPERYVALK
ncbi:hypothetical protein [Agrobacterium tumefaciens]|uniref:DUF1904 family protein n=1 Tax=Agrobacterium tumefaciens TaxID=358 RepID=A0A2L2LM42_AGRTU|nr:hypothetical protein [Agrobacterium tumefaciens]AVH45403.1 hypothetical protein At1D1609_53710 [Agrobacterium tumefaciens]NSY99132.1 hypothetical protein [Agrobacterium tumefaciens]